MKLFYTTCMFLFIATKMFGQVSHATTSATIVTPVGAELSADINETKKINTNAITNPADITSKNNQKENDVSYLKIIGDIFSHYTTVENDDVILIKKESEEILPGKKSFVRITVNFD